MLAEEKIMFLITAWIIISLFVTGDTELGIFFIFVTIGFITVKEFTSHFIPNQLKLKMNLFIILFMIIFTVFIGKRIIDFLNT